MLRKGGYSNGSSTGVDSWVYSEPKKRWTPPWKRKLGTLQYVVIVSSLVSALVLLWLAYREPQHQHRIHLPYTSGDVLSFAHLHPSSLEYPIWWHAPFVSQSGDFTAAAADKTVTCTRFSHCSNRHRMLRRFCSLQSVADIAFQCHSFPRMLSAASMTHGKPNSQIAFLAACIADQGAAVQQQLSLCVAVVAATAHSSLEFIRKLTGVHHVIIVLCLQV